MNVIAIQLFLLFCYILLGYVCNKIGLFNAHTDHAFSNLLLKITLPASIIVSSIGQNPENKETALLVIMIAGIIFAIKPILAGIFQKCFNCEDTYKLMLTYPNLGFMGFPIIKVLYGNLGLFYASLFMIVFNLSVFSYGVSVIEKNNRFMISKLLNPGIVSAVLAVIIFVFSLPVPVFIETFLSSIGNITSPLAMITLGSTLAAVKIRSAFNDRLLLLFSLCKLVIWPLLVWLPLHMIINNPLIIGTAVILVSLPVAGNVSMLCISYGGNVNLAAKGTLITTAFSFISIPIYMYLFSF